MKEREERIDFHMSYCQHYQRGNRAEMICAAGMDIKAIMQVPVREDKIKWGPCIYGHTLPDPHKYCPKWIRRTRESAEKRADEIENSLLRIKVVMPVVNEWRKKEPFGKAEVIECPACKGKLHLSQSAYNGHVHGRCQTEGCVSWME